MGCADGRFFYRFPNPGWAWPRGNLDQLLFSAIAPDQELALATFRSWLSATDIDDMGFREHRLLAVVAERFVKTVEGP